MDRLKPTREGYVLLTLLLISALCGQKLAADFQTGMEAYEQGDYAEALRRVECASRTR